MKNRRLEIVKRKFLSDKGMWLAAFFIVTIIMASIIVSFTGIDPEAIDVGNMLQRPSKEHWFGTDELGRDYFARVLYGARISLIVGVMAMLTSVTIGVVVGMISGYFGGIVDSICMRAVDVICAIPWIIMVTVVSLLFKKGLASIIIVIGCFSWMEIARLVRTETMSAKNREYVQYAELIGVFKFKIILQHILPTIFPVIITAATSAIANAIMVESSMSFLGIGIQPPMSSWGSLLKTAQTNLSKAPYMAFIPGLLIVFTICSFNKLGDLLRLYAEPRVTQEEK
ncbi:MAG: ABC transporter permease [Schaedlerella sp.]|nr:ABC transporter permease [Schaedlerella sp.]